MRIALLLLVSALAGCISDGESSVQEPEPPRNATDTPTATLPTRIDGSWTGAGGTWILVVQPLVPGSYSMEHDSEVDFASSGGDDATLFYGPFLVLENSSNQTAMPWMSTRASVTLQEEGPAIEEGNPFIGRLETPPGFQAVALATLAAAKTDWQLDWTVSFNETSKAAGPLQVHRGDGATWHVERATHVTDPSASTSQAASWDLPAGVTLFQALPRCPTQDNNLGACSPLIEREERFAFPGDVWTCNQDRLSFTKGYLGHPAGTMLLESSFEAPMYGYDYVVGHAPIPPELLPVDAGHFTSGSGTENCKPDEVPS